MRVLDFEILNKLAHATIKVDYSYLIMLKENIWESYFIDPT